MKEFERIQEADWVVAPRELAAPVITRRFYVGAAGRAELQISALGFMIPYVNADGKPRPSCIRFSTN